MRPITTEPGYSANRFLKILGVLVMLLGFVAAITVWMEFGTELVPGGGYRGTETQASPFGIALGSAVALEGVLVCTLCFVLGDAADNVLRIRRAVEPEEKPEAATRNGALQQSGVLLEEPLEGL